MASNDFVRLRHSTSWPRLMGNGSPLRNCSVEMERATRRRGSGKSSGRNRTPLTSEKIAALAPMPMARLSTAMAAKPRSFQSVLNAYFMYDTLGLFNTACAARGYMTEYTSLHILRESYFGKPGGNR